MSRLRIHGFLWGLLVLGILGVTGAYVVSLTQPRLPVISHILPFSLTNQAGMAVNAGSLKGRPWVANVIFSRCPTQCRKLSRQMQKLQSLVGESARMVTLTADPEFDTPEVLKRYGKQYEANPERWWFLTGNRKEIYRLAIEDLKFTVLETGTPGGKLEDLFIHSANFVIVDRHGNLRAVVQSEDVNAEEEVVRVLQDLRYQP